MMPFHASGHLGYAGRHEREVERLSDPPAPRRRSVDPTWIWRVPFTPLSMAAAVSAIGELIETGQPTFFITANTNYVMLTEQNPDLQAINAQAALILADGSPLVWASCYMGTPLPERVAGADLAFELSAQASRLGHRLFFVGGAAGVAEQAARRLRELYPGLQVVGTECPTLEDLTREEETALIARIRAARPHILVVAFGQPKGERWIHQHLGELGVPISVQVGAALDFVAGRIPRAPRWMRNSGLEWAFRLMLEPRRLFGRYVRNGWFIVRMVAGDLRQAIARRCLHHSSSLASSRERDSAEDNSAS